MYLKINYINYCMEFILIHIVMIGLFILNHAVCLKRSGGSFGFNDDGNQGGFEMSLNKQKGNMYGFITDTWNVVKGKCPHACKYCYMNQERLNPRRFDKAELKTDLEKDLYIFVGSSNDMWAEDMPDGWISLILYKCLANPDNKYLFQTKNPKGFIKHLPELKRLGAVLCVTIESNCEYPEYHNAPDIAERVEVMGEISNVLECRTMVTIEPIMDFDIGDFIVDLIDISPDYINIGADSKRHKLPEPPKEKIIEFISALKEANLNILEEKKNLNRLLK